MTQIGRFTLFFSYQGHLTGVRFNGEPLVDGSDMMSIYVYDNRIDKTTTEADIANDIVNTLQGRIARYNDIIHTIMG